MLTCTWAPTTFAGTQVVRGSRTGSTPSGDQLTALVTGYVKKIEDLGISHLLIPQRWWGNAREIEGSSLDCLAMTAFIAAQTERINLITAIHPGFFEPGTIAKWGATMDYLTGGRWSINVTSGWNLEEFSMYGIDALDHDTRYARTAEFVEVLKGAWNKSLFSYSGDYYQLENLVLEPAPRGELLVFQGGQSDAAINLACTHSDWMFLNGGSLEKITGIIDRVRTRAGETGHCPKFAVYGIPLCRETDAEAAAEIDAMIAAIDPALLSARRERVSGAEGMWSGADELAMLDTNEGYATGLIGSPDTIVRQVRALQDTGVEMLHLALGDSLFEEAVLPQIIDL